MKRFSLIYVIVTCIVISGLLPGCDFLSLESDIQTLHQIEAFTGVELPADADEIHYETGGFQDTIIWLRFDASPDDVQVYLDALGFEEPLTAEGSFIQPDAPETTDWWITEAELQGSNVVGGSYSNFEANLHYQAVVDQTNPDRWRIYLVAFNT